MSTPISGKGGYVTIAGTKVARIKKCTIKRTSKNAEWSDSDSGGEMTRLAGVRDTTGSCDFVFDKDTPVTATAALNAGTLVALTTVLGTGVSYAVPKALIDDITFDVDIESGAPVSGSFSWSQAPASTSDAPVLTGM